MWAYLLRTFGNKEAYDWHRMFCFATDRYHQEVFTVSLHHLLNNKVWCVDIFLHKMVFSDEFASWAKLELCLI